MAALTNSPEIHASAERLRSVLYHSANVMRGSAAFDTACTNLIEIIGHVLADKLVFEVERGVLAPRHALLRDLLSKEWDPDFYAVLCGTGSKLDRLLAEWFRGNNTAPARMDPLSTTALNKIVDLYADDAGLTGGKSTGPIASRLRCHSAPLYVHSNEGMDSIDFVLTVHLLTTSGAPLAWDTPNPASALTRLYRNDAVSALSSGKDKILTALFTNDEGFLSDTILTEDRRSIAHIIASDRILKF